MKLSTLKNKLNKAEIESTVKDFNGFNMALIFTIKNITFSAAYNNVSQNIEDFTTSVGYDDANQETERIIFRSYSAVMAYVKKQH